VIPMGVATRVRAPGADTFEPAVRVGRVSGRRSERALEAERSPLVVAAHWPITSCRFAVANGCPIDPSGTTRGRPSAYMHMRCRMSAVRAGSMTLLGPRYRFYCAIQKPATAMAAMVAANVEVTLVGWPTEMRLSRFGPLNVEPSVCLPRVGAVPQGRCRRRVRRISARVGGRGPNLGCFAAGDAFVPATGLSSPPRQHRTGSAPKTLSVDQQRLAHQASSRSKSVELHHRNP